MYYVVKSEWASSPGYAINRLGAKRFESLDEAKRFADQSHTEHGGLQHFNILKVETVWSTKTLADLIEEDRST
jgi:hypothetical protein